MARGLAFNEFRLLASLIGYLPLSPIWEWFIATVEDTRLDAIAGSCLSLAVTGSQKGENDVSILV